MIKELSIDNVDEYICLAHEVVNNLENREFLIPCSEEDLKNILCDSNTRVYGYYEDNKLVASAQLIKKSDCRELGGFLTIPKYRGKGIMKKLCNYILKNNDFSKIFITVHPNNVASTKVIESLGARFVEQKIISNYKRNVYEILK